MVSKKIDITPSDKSKSIYLDIDGAMRGEGEWNYETNEQGLKDFWRKGIENMINHESIITMGMRGDGDKPMTQGTAIMLLENILSDQRQILEDVTGKPASEIPQLWALYKGVQEYYDEGMRVPDDVTLLLCDDNWGNIRRLPQLDEKPRIGGYGIYYHFDYVGGSRNYKWINTNNIARVWEQMHLAYEHDVRQIWIVKVGDLKPMELPISFFLEYAWNVNKWNEDNLSEYYVKWATEQFGVTHAEQIAEVLTKYAQYASRRKPELLDARTYSIENYNEANRVTEDWDLLQKKAEALNSEIPKEQKDTFYQLVLHPVKAYGNLQSMYTAVGWNRHYAKQNTAIANRYAEEAKEFYEMDSLITLEYHQLNNGKWNHMMSQNHIGYTYWQEPRVQRMPEVKYGQDIDTVQQMKSKKESHASEPETVTNDRGNIFYEKSGYVSINAANYTRKVDRADVRWKVIPNIGREGDGITTFPVTRGIDQLTETNPHLQYDFSLDDAGEVEIDIFCSLTLNYLDNDEGLQFAISVDDSKPQIISLKKFNVDSREWGQTVSNKINIRTVCQQIEKNGNHTLKLWAISPGVVLQKLVLDLGGLKPSYFGPEETRE